MEDIIFCILDNLGNLVVIKMLYISVSLGIKFKKKFLLELLMILFVEIEIFNKFSKGWYVDIFVRIFVKLKFFKLVYLLL